MGRCSTLYLSFCLGKSPFLSRPSEREVVPVEIEVAPPANMRARPPVWDRVTSVDSDAGLDPMDGELRREERDHSYPPDVRAREAEDVGPVLQAADDGEYNVTSA